MTFNRLKSNRPAHISSWAELRHGFSCRVTIGRLPGGTFATLCSRLSFRCTDAPILGDSGGNIVRGMLYQKDLSRVFGAVVTSIRSCNFFFIVDVDDFKLAGPKANLDKGWRLLQQPSEGCPKG
eukprot:2600592-Pyramimonas_sp.AAC.1